MILRRRMNDSWPYTISPIFKTKPSNICLINGHYYDLQNQYPRLICFTHWLNNPHVNMNIYAAYEG